MVRILNFTGAETIQPQLSTRKGYGKIDWNTTTAKRNKTRTISIILEMYQIRWRYSGLFHRRFIQFSTVTWAELIQVHDAYATWHGVTEDLFVIFYVTNKSDITQLHVAIVKSRSNGRCNETPTTHVKYEHHILYVTSVFMMLKIKENIGTDQTIFIIHTPRLLDYTPFMRKAFRTPMRDV